MELVQHPSCSVTWNHAISTSFHIHQGVRQDAILSPLLYFIFVNELVDLLTISGLRVTIDTISCGAPMYTNNLALVADSPEELQAMLNIVCTYAGKWRYNFNTGKSFAMVFGESLRSRTDARSSRKWYLGSKALEEADKVHNLGILRMASLSTISQTTEHCTAGRSAFFCIQLRGV